MSWFNSRSKNRLHKHDLKGLDSKMRTKLRAQRQSRMLLYIFLGFLGLGTVSWGIWEVGQWMGGEMFFENDSYRITRISVESSGDVLRPEQVLAYLKVQRGQNLFALDIQRMRKEIEALPMVEKAVVSRDLPSHLVIRISERIPVANISSAAKDLRYQIDTHGVVMDLMYHQRNPEFQRKLSLLPAIIGANVADLKIGRSTPSPEIVLAIRLLQKLQRTDIGIDLEAESIDVSRSGFITVVTPEHSLIKFNGVDLDRQLRRLAVIMEDARQRSARIATVDLTVEKDVPVTFAATSQNT